ncbi:MAG: glycerol acyltransferase, partial [Halieaceae bacterium]|nr:glycerol acyltransferase [Halieaceae bacterium]
MNEANDPYSDIRPYRDDEVARVLYRLRAERGLINTLAQWKLGPLYRLVPSIARMLVKMWLVYRLKPLTTVDAVQMQLRPLLANMVSKTVRLSSDGLESLDPTASWLFVSNHRDIALDPALTNHILYHSGHRTLAIAIGDNLLKERWVADLMRLNKSFIVKRTLSGSRELLAASRQLAAFIRTMVTTNQGPVWIAQRE